MATSEEINSLVDQIYVSKTLTVEDYISQVLDRILSKPHEMHPLLQTFAQVILKSETSSFDSNAVKAIVEFIIDQSYEHTEYPMFDVLLKMVEQPNFPSGSALRSASYVFECNDVQEHQEKAIRLAAIRVIKKLLIRGDNAFRSQGVRWVNGYIKATTGERNPEVLLENFELAQQNLHKNEQLMDELFNALCIYFPIRFTGSNESDKRLGQQLDVALREALTSSPTFGSLLGVFLIDKLQDADDSYKDKVDLCLLLRDFLRDYDSKIVAPFIQGILDGLRATAMDPRHKGANDEISQATTKILLALFNENRLLYDKIAKHNFDNIEPFLVRPEMGLLEKAVKFVKPWTEVNEETEISNFLKNKITEILFNDIQGAALVDYAQEALVILGNWLDFYTSDASKILKNAREAKFRALDRIIHDFASLALSHMHIIAKIDILENGQLSGSQIVNYLKPVLIEGHPTQVMKNSALTFVQNLPYSSYDSLSIALQQLSVEHPGDLFVNELACFAIGGKDSFDTFKHTAFDNFTEETCVTILQNFLEAKSNGNPSSRNDKQVVQNIVLWLKENFKLKMDTSLLGHRERIIELAEILFELCKDTDESSQLNNLSMPEGYPYFSLLAIQATASGKVNIPISFWHKCWSPYHPKLELCLRYASLVQEEPELQTLELIDVVSLKKRALDEQPLDYHLVTEIFDKNNCHVFPFDVLFDFSSIWFSHERLGLKYPKRVQGMDYRERFIFQVFYPMLKYVDSHKDRLPEFVGMFAPALQLIASIPSFQYDKEGYYSMVLGLVMKAIANEEHITVEKTQLMILLPELMKHSKQSDNVNEMFETVLNIAFRTMEAGQSQVVLLSCITTLVGLIENSPSVLADHFLRLRLFQIADKCTISSSRSVRKWASLVKKMLASSTS